MKKLLLAAFLLCSMEGMGQIFPKGTKLIPTTSCDTCKIAYSTGYAPFTISKPKPFLMNIIYHDTSDVVRININPKEMEKLAIWLNDSTLILLKKLK